MSRSSIIFVLIAFIIGAKPSLAQIPSRARSCCGLMNGKIYCYGGDTFTPPSTFKANSIMNMLDLTNASGKLASDLQNMWQPVSFNINGVDLSSRTDPQCAFLEDGKHMVINGGYDAYRPGQLNNLNVVYDADKNQWDALPSYSEPPYGRRQIYYGSATNIPGKGVAFYGGYEEHGNASWSIPSTGNLSTFDFDTPTASRFVGYSQVAVFQYENKTNYWSLLAPLSNLASELSAGQMSVYDPVNDQIVFMGGGYRSNRPPNATFIPRPFTNISAVNVSNSHWQQLLPTGQGPQQKRVYATTTLLPATNRHVLLFGGEIQDAGVCIEYCFTLNLDTYTWKKQVIAAPTGTVLQRSRHSAVLVNNDTLFIMWGRNVNNAGINTMLILNVSDPENISLSNKYVDPNAPNASEESQNNTATNDDGSGSSTNPNTFTGAGLSTGAKAGIAVACIVVGVLALALIWFYLRNKKNKERIRQQQQEIAAQQRHQEEQDAEPMEVDWDQIENKYTEVPPGYTFHHRGNSQDLYPMNFNGNTLVNDSEPSFPKTVAPDAVEIQNPNAIDSTDIRHASSPR